MRVMVVSVMVCAVAVAGCKGQGKVKDQQAKAPAAGDAGGDAAAVRPPPRPIAVPPDAKLDVRVLEKARVDALGSLLFEPAVRPQLCFQPPPVDPATIDIDRSLFVHDRATLDALGDAFSLRRTLDELAADAVAAGAAGTTAQTLFRDLWDTQNPRASGATAGGAHCDDAGTTLNGFPNVCRPLEGAQAKAPDLLAEMATYRPIGLVNRLDLAAEGWKNCGEHRIVYGRRGAGRARSFIIFEAVLPNPRPGCQSGCRAVAERWRELSSTPSPRARAQLLEEFFYRGLPGFQPVVRFDHYTATGPSTGYGGAGSGQIRTNQFLESPWTLKEFKLAVDCSTRPCVADVVPIPVKNNPDGNLWTETTAGLGNDFQQTVVLPQAVDLGKPGLLAFSYGVPVVYDAARSDSQSGGLADHYTEAYTAVPGVPGGFRASLAAAASGGLTDRQLVNRALALSCAGCHQPSTFGLLASQDANAISAGVGWPDALSFVHVDAVEDAAGIHALSPALVDHFLPARRQHLADFLNTRVCLCRFKGPRVNLPQLEDRVFPRPPRSLQELRAAETRLKRDLDRDLLRRRLAPLPALDAVPTAPPLDLPDVRAAGPDLARAAAARTRAVLKIVSDEPPRKTVTGHFRTH